MAELGSIIDLKVDYKEVAEYIGKTGGWSEIPGKASFRGNGFSGHKFHIFPETVESFIEEGGVKDFAMSNMAKKFNLKDYPYVKIKSFNTKTGITKILDIIADIGGMFGTKSEPGSSGSPDSTKEKSKQELSEKFSDFAQSIVTRAVNAIGKLKDFIGNITSNPDFLYRQLPNMMSFTIPGASVNNEYELPLLNLSKIVEVNGDFGWTNEGFINKLIGMAQGFLLTPVQPFFIPESGMGNNYPSVTLQFPLFNDTREHAMDNYKFIHTILPWNMWVQWGMAVLPAVLYDVKIQGGLRMKACAARMNVSYVGTMREVDPTWTDAMGEVVVVPDVYVLTCTFESILNSNFNHYLLSFDPDDKTAPNPIQQIGSRIQQDVEREERENEERIYSAVDEAGGASNMDIYTGGGGGGGISVASA